jgi:hypothetical protein
VQARDRIEKVVWRNRTYHRADWRGVSRHAPRRIADTPRGAVCGLWALGEMLETHLVVGADGSVHEIAAPPRDPGAQGETGDAMPDGVVAGIAAVIAATGAPALSPFVARAMAAMHAEWGSVAGDLLDIRDATLRFSPLLCSALASRLAASPSREARAHVALAALTEMAMLAADTIRARAQRLLMELDEAAQSRALTSPPPPDAAAATRITAAVEALLAAPGQPPVRSA